MGHHWLDGHYRPLKEVNKSGGTKGVLDYRPAMAKPTVMVKTACELSLLTNVGG